MKRFIFIAAFLVLVASVCGSATYAQDSSTSATPVLTNQEKIQNRVLDIKDRIASRSAQLKLKLQTFKDQKKAKIVEKVDGNLAQINQTRTGNMLKSINVLSTIISKLSSRVQGVTDKDTTAAKSSIDQANSAISTAQTAVTAQSQKDYPIEATSEATIKDEVVGARLNLHADLKNAQGLLAEARKAVIAALDTTIQTLGGGTTSGQ